VTSRRPAEREDDDRRSPFEHFAEWASEATSSPPFFVVCVLVVAVWVAVHASGQSTEWQHIAGDVMAAITLMLLALLKNSELRAEHAIQKKLDAIASAILEQREGKTMEAHRDLERAIGMHEEV
jgi:low affinity Fe/Cu permease